MQTPWPAPGTRVPGRRRKTFFAASVSSSGSGIRRPPRPVATAPRRTGGGPHPQQDVPAGWAASLPMAPPWSASRAFPKANWMAMIPIRTCRIPLTVKPVLAATTKTREFGAPSTASAAPFSSFLMAIPFQRLQACDRPRANNIFPPPAPKAYTPGTWAFQPGTGNYRIAHGWRPTGMRQAT